MLGGGMGLDFHRHQNLNTRLNESVLAFYDGEKEDGWAKRKEFGGASGSWALALVFLSGRLGSFRCIGSR